MSSFNLDRFRFDKNTKTPVKPEPRKEPSPESEKENKPVKLPQVRKSSHTAGVVFIDSSDDDDEDVVVVSVTPSKKDGDGEEEKMKKLLAMFPQLTRQQVREVVETWSTLDGAVAACLLRFGDKDKGLKRKMESSSPQESPDVQAAKKHRTCIKVEDNDEDDDDEDEEGDGNEEEEEEEPDWDKQEEMLRRLHKKFPTQDKEELRTVLQGHFWKYAEALQALQMFSDPEISTSGKTKSKKSKQKDISESDATEDSEDSEDSEGSEDEEGLDHDPSPEQKQEQPKDEPASDDTIDSEDYHSEPQTSKLTISAWVQRDGKNITVKKSAQSTSVTTQAKKAAVERRQRARTSGERVSSEDDDGSVSSEFEDSDEEMDLKSKGLMDVKDQILCFLNDSTIDELTLISGCSVKKAQKILELRPFKNWDGLVDLIHKHSGLSEDLLVGCKLVLRERKVVLGLMSKCETISSKLIQQVTEVMKSGSTRQPELLNADFQLKPYQIIGLKWLILLHEHKLSCILADEMGLGKTIQAIAFLAQLYETGVTGPHLITVPSSTLDNWVRELKTWCPTFNVLVYYGSAEDRRYLKHDILTGAVDFDVIVTTYNLAYGNDSDRSLFRKLPLTYAVFDEGHMLKNMNTLRYKHLMAINAQHRLLLTGTPVQNNLLELMSLLNFIMPSMFSSSTSQLSKMFSMKSHEEQSRFEQDRISQAKRIMKPFILRRVKNEVLKQLPAKEETVEFCPMSVKQKELYRSLLNRLRQSSSREKRELCNVMMQLRKMANHPLLHRQYYSSDKLREMSKLMIKEPTHHDADPALIQEDMEVMSDFELHNLCKQYTSISSYQLHCDLLLDSGKFRLLSHLLTTLKDQGDRVVLFSQFTMMLDIVEVFLKHLKHQYVRLDGSTPIADRIVLIDQFNSDPEIFVFLLSTRAGGLGINLTSANVVILHDIDCNPYNDKQAEDRCHRVGQTRTVKVIKLISKDSIEDCILTLGQKKLKLEQDMTAAEDGGEGTIPEDMATLLKTSLGL